jgi:hypothetical protein
MRENAVAIIPMERLASDQRKYQQAVAAVALFDECFKLIPPSRVLALGAGAHKTFFRTDSAVAVVRNYMIAHDMLDSAINLKELCAIIVGGRKEGRNMKKYSYPDRQILFEAAPNTVIAKWLASEPWRLLSADAVLKAQKEEDRERRRKQLQARAEQKREKRRRVRLASENSPEEEAEHVSA